MKVKDCEKCNGCPMQRLFPENNLVPPEMGRGNRLVVGEAPGEEEAAQQRPFVGGSGRIFNMLLAKAGIKRDELTILNCIQCRPPNNIYPTDAAARGYISKQDGEAAVSQCYREHVAPVLASRPWTRIDAVGEKSLRELTGKTDGIMKWRGSPLPLIGEDKEKVIGICHPSYLMRSQELIPATISDLKKGLDVPPEYYNLRPTVEDLDAFMDAPILCADIETNRRTNQITMVGLATRPFYVTVVPWSGRYISALKKVFASAKEFVGQNCVHFDIPFLEANDVKFDKLEQVWDIMLMHHLVQPDLPHDLEFISSIFTQKAAWKHLAQENEALYNARDVDVTLLSFLQLRPLLKMLDLENIYTYSQVPLAKICTLMHDTGVKTDPARLRQLRAKFQAELMQLEEKLPQELKPYDKPIRVRKSAPPGTLGKSGKPVKYIHEDAFERVVPWNSPKRVEEYLYGQLGLPSQFHPKTKKLTSDKNALDKLYRKTKNVSVEALRQIRQLDELLSSFLKEDNSTNVEQGHVHPSFLPHGTNTGRLSCSNPNMQNQPPKSRYIYVPLHNDWIFIEMDFSSLENRLAMWFANDEERLKRTSIPGFNEHRWFASQIFKIPEEQISKDSHEYKMGKIANHGSDGAMGPRKLAITHNIPEKEARDLIFQWRTINRRSAEWQEQVGNKATREGVLRNPFGRKRWFGIQSAYTEGIRFLPQSAGADVCFRTMIGLMYERINWPEELARRAVDILAPLPRPAELCLQVHDSLLVSCPLNLKEKCIEAMRKVATQPWPQLGGFSFNVAFKVGNPGESWAELREEK